MKRTFKVEKLPLDSLINLLIELYESGIDYIDMSSDNTDPAQDKLIIQTKDSYINPSFPKDGFRSHDSSNDPQDEDDDRDSEDDDDIPPKHPPIIETKKLTDDDINNLL